MSSKGLGLDGHVDDGDEAGEEASVDLGKPAGKKIKSQVKPVALGVETNPDAFKALADVIAKSKDYELLELLSKAGTKDDLLQKTEFGRLNPKLVHALDGSKKQVKQLVAKANERLEQLDKDRKEVNKKVLKEDGTKWRTLKSGKLSALKAPMKGLKPLKGLQDDLSFLQKTSLVWINPAFQDSAKQYATDLEDRFKEVADGCDLIVPYLYEQQL